MNKVVSVGLLFFSDLLHTVQCH
uniref:Uncharacterized protein n=1 Tax=Anguilla anguilla TaxID=7936 RepID=A0A0E9U7I6_ANGAN